MRLRTSRIVGTWSRGPGSITPHDEGGCRSPRTCNEPYRVGAASGESGEALATQLAVRARLTESIMYHPDHFISEILCQFRVSPLTRLMLWVCFNPWTFMLAQLLARLFAG